LWSNYIHFIFFHSTKMLFYKKLSQKPAPLLLQESLPAGRQGAGGEFLL